MANILVELREHFEHRISFFSGIDFSIDPESGLTGVCDFLVSVSPDQFYLKAPAIILVEAKNADPATGLGQCVAEMLAAQRFNAEKGNEIPLPALNGYSSNWKDKNSTLIWEFTQLNSAARSSVSSQVWLIKRHRNKEMQMGTLVP